jgi:hypothetical protein
MGRCGVFLSVLILIFFQLLALREEKFSAICQILSFGYFFAALVDEHADF